MNKIERMLNQLCPRGVNYKAIEDVVLKISSMRWQDQGDSEYKYIDLSSVDRSTHAITDTPFISKKNAPSRAQQIVQEGDVIFGTTRPLLKRYTIITKDFDKQICSTGFCVLRPDRTHILPSFLFHLLGTKHFYSYVEVNERGASYPAIPDSLVKKFRIPVPPLDIQKEIVKTLDNFTELGGELEAEIEARRTQYKHYREVLLTFEDAKQAKWTTLSEISINISSGGTPLSTRKDYYDGDIPWLRTQEVRFLDIDETEIKITEKGLKDSSAKWIPANCVIIAISGATAGRSAINKIPLTTNQHCCNLEIDASQANYRYVFHWVSKEYEKLKALGQGARSDLTSAIIKKYPIQLPCIKEQNRIVSILDKFDALVNDTSEGLPAEIMARHQQYEHYRDQLLSFHKVN